MPAGKWCQHIGDAPADGVRQSGRIDPLHDAVDHDETHRCAVLQALRRQYDPDQAVARDDIGLFEFARGGEQIRRRNPFAGNLADDGLLLLAQGRKTTLDIDPGDVHEQPLRSRRCLRSRRLRNDDLAPLGRRRRSE